MCDHTSPGSNQSQTKKLGADESANDAHTPHADDIEDKWNHGLSQSLHHTFQNDWSAVNWF